MAQVAYSKLKIKRDDTVSIIKYAVNEETSYDIEVRNYLPLSAKLNIIERVLNSSYDENNFYNIGKIDMYLLLNIMYNYTNLKFTEDKVNRPGDLYDELISSNLASQIIDVLKENGEYDILVNMLMEMVKSIYQYNNSLMGIISQVANNFDESNDKFQEIQEKLSNPENLALVKDILTKLG